MGGVATGIINARDDEIAIAAIIPNGGIFKLMARDAAIGIRIVAVAVFELNSVSIFVIVTTSKIIKKIDVLLKKTRLEDTHSARPVSIKALAIANPPPKRITTPHGTFTVSSHISSYYCSLPTKIIRAV
ncbi:MAG: hypothetical protein U9P81_09365 [Euryarchaeota archaeon]|nr:hypothetical protein [Euryarchaeota archaeon]